MRAYATGTGCDDGSCIWITGAEFRDDTEIIVRDAWWNVIGTYEHDARAWRSSFTDFERQSLASNGLILTIANGSDDWVNASVNR